jgi:hypothetical protein
MNLCRISAKHTRAVLAGGPAVWVGWGHLLGGHWDLWIFVHW